MNDDRTMTQAVQKYGEGDIFGVPLGHGLYAIGLITRRKPRSPICFGYFFGPPYSGLPTMLEVPALRPNQSVEKCMFGDLGLLNGNWPVIGKLTPWKREEWQFPLFYVQDDKSGRTLVVQYSDKNPAKTIAQYRADAPPPGAVRDSLAGYKSVEIGLRKIFGLPKPLEVN